MTYAISDDGCPMCGSTAGPDSDELSTDQSVLREQMDRLHGRWVEASNGVLDADVMDRYTPSLCGFCRRMLGYRDAWDIGAGPFQNQISQAMERIQTRLFAMEDVGATPPAGTDEPDSFASR